MHITVLNLTHDDHFLCEVREETAKAYPCTMAMVCTTCQADVVAVRYPNRRTFRAQGFADSTAAGLLCRWHTCQTAIDAPI